MENMKDYTLWEWFKRLVSGHPHIRIFPDKYIDRWHLIPRNDWFNVYLHRYYGGDMSRAPHDHPWWNATLVLRGGFNEHMYRHSDTGHFDELLFVRTAGDWVSRQATDIHRIVLPDHYIGKTWTLFFTGKKVRKWGFWEEDGRTWVAWEEYAEKTGFKDYRGVVTA